LNFNLALEACRNAGHLYYAVAPLLDESGTRVGAVLAVIAPGESEVVVHMFRGVFRKNFGQVGRVSEPEVPAEVKELKFRPYSAGFWHQPLDPEVQAALQSFGRSM
jgi:hypothetical protein